MDKGEASKYLETIFGSSKELHFVKRHLSFLERKYKFFLMEKPMRDKDTTITYQCEIPKCPFMISFNHNSKGYTLCSYELFHTHHLGDSDAFAFRSMIKEIEGYTEFVYKEYFVQRINHEKESIVF